MRGAVFVQGDVRGFHHGADDFARGEVLDRVRGEVAQYGCDGVAAQFQSGVAAAVIDDLCVLVGERALQAGGKCGFVLPRAF